MKNYIYYTLLAINDWLSIDLKDSRIIRAVIGGTWCKQTMSGELPGCYGSWWTRNPLKPNRYH